MNTSTPSFSIARDQLLTALLSVQNAVTHQATLPILSNVRIETTQGQVHFTATNLDISLCTSAEALVEIPGSTTLPVKRLSSIVKELTGAQVHLETDSKNITSLRCGSTFFKIHGLPPDEFPKIPTVPQTHQITLKQADLRNALRRTIFAISTDETRYVLNGLYFALEKQTLNLVATDGRRLANVQIELEKELPEPLQIIIPTKAIAEVKNMLTEKGEIQITIGGNQVLFQSETTQLTSKLVEGNYPNYKQVIPGDNRHRITFERTALLEAITRVSLLSPEKNNNIKLIFTKNNLELAANTPDVGQATESLPVAYKGQNLTIAFNPTYLADPLKALTEDEVHLDLIDENSPGVYRTGTSFLHVLMPVRTA